MRSYSVQSLGMKSYNAQYDMKTVRSQISVNKKSIGLHSEETNINFGSSR